MNFKPQLENKAKEYAEQFWNAREELEEEEQNSFDAEKDAFQAGAKWAMQSEAVGMLKQALDSLVKDVNILPSGDWARQMDYVAFIAKPAREALAAFEAAIKELE